METRPREVTGRAEWRPWFDQARYRDIVRDAERTGFAPTVRTLPLPELWLLAEACRYDRRGRHAVDALEEVRRRFPATSQARRAAYLLGRVHADALGAHQSACQWFQRYLAESPTGPLQEETLGRLMDACRRAGESSAARRAARLYLVRFPEGAFRPVAEVILEKGPMPRPGTRVPAP